MVQKQTKLIPVDRCGIWMVRTLHTYTKLKKFAKVGGFIKSSVRVTRPDQFFLKKKKTKGLLVRLRYIDRRSDGSTIFSSTNGAMLLKKRLNPRGSVVRGYTSRNVNRKKLLSAYIKSI